MVITSTPNGSSTTTLEQVEPVNDEPPIGGQHHIQVKEKSIETGIGASVPASSRDELCKNAHTCEVAYLATQLGVDVEYVTPSNFLIWSTDENHHELQLCEPSQVSKANINKLVMALATMKQQIALRRMDPTRSRILNGFPCSRFS